MNPHKINPYIDFVPSFGINAGGACNIRFQAAWPGGKGILYVSSYDHSANTPAPIALVALYGHPGDFLELNLIPTVGILEMGLPSEIPANVADKQYYFEYMPGVFHASFAAETGQQMSAGGWKLLQLP